MTTELRCQDLYQDGCTRPIHGPAWYHEGEWIDYDGRFPGPHLREDLPEATVRVRAASTERDVRLAVLWHRATPDDVVDALIEDESVRAAALARTHSVPLLRRWASGGDWSEREAVARNPATPPDLLIRLAADPEHGVRTWVMSNPATPAEVVDAGTDNPHPHVRAWALYGANSAARLRRAATGDDADERACVARNPHLPPELMRRLATDPDRRVRFELALNAALPPDVRNVLRADPYFTVANVARLGPTSRANGDREPLRTLIGWAGQQDRAIKDFFRKIFRRRSASAPDE